jgi:hypothetical protein
MKNRFISKVVSKGGLLTKAEFKHITSINPELVAPDNLEEIKKVSEGIFKELVKMNITKTNKLDLERLDMMADFLKSLKERVLTIDLNERLKNQRNETKGNYSDYIG